MHPAERLQSHLPDSGTMGRLRQTSLGLYALALIGATGAFIATTGLILLGSILLALTAFHALSGALVGDAIRTAQWFLLAGFAASATGAAAVLAARWVATAGGDV